MPQYCPHCGDEIDHLKYEADFTDYGREWGTCSTDGDDTNCDDRECNDGETNDFQYRCPNCDHDVSPDDILDSSELEDNDDEDEDEPEFDNDMELDDSDDENILDNEAEVVRPGGNRLINPEGQKKMSRSIECPECHHIVFRDLNEAAICENCNHEIE